MKILCKFGKHSYIPQKVFTTTTVRDVMKPDTTIVDYYISWHGYQCTRCCKRKIRKTRKPQSPGATQKAYDWLNEYKKVSTVLKLVKKL